jgi:hypothetical protein
MWNLLGINSNLSSKNEAGFNNRVENTHFWLGVSPPDLGSGGAKVRVKN